MTQHRLSPSGAPIGGGLDLGDACITEDYVPNGGDTAQVATFDLTALLNDLSVSLDEPMQHRTIAAELTSIENRNIDGSPWTPQVRRYMIAFWLDDAGNVNVDGDAMSNNNLESGVANTPLGGLTNYGDGGGPTAIAATATGADKTLTITQTGPSTTFRSITGKLCLKVATSTIPTDP